MENSFLMGSVNDIDFDLTSHGVGLKKVFVRHNECLSNLQQFAYGSLIAGDEIEEHIHPSMEEFYFLTSGKLSFRIGNICFNCSKGDYIMVPCGEVHQMNAISDVTFVYFGIKI